MYIHTALVQEQIRHKEKLDKEIASSMEEKGKLTKDLSKLEQELVLKEQQRRTTANSNAQVIILMWKFLDKISYLISYLILPETWLVILCQ